MTVKTGLIPDLRTRFAPDLLALVCTQCLPPMQPSVSYCSQRLHILLAESDLDETYGPTHVHAANHVVRPSACLVLPNVQMLQPSITNPPSKALSIIIPAFNEEERLGPSLDEILE